MIDKTYYETHYAGEIKRYEIQKLKALLVGVILLTAHRLVSVLITQPFVSSILMFILLLLSARFFFFYFRERHSERFYRGLLDKKPPFS
jgi:hypothetical protein